MEDGETGPLPTPNPLTDRHQSLYTLNYPRIRTCKICAKLRTPGSATFLSLVSTLKRDIDRTILSVRPSVRSVAFRYIYANGLT